MLPLFNFVVTNGLDLLTWIIRKHVRLRNILCSYINRNIFSIFYYEKGASLTAFLPIGQFMLNKVEDLHWI